LLDAAGLYGLMKSIESRLPWGGGDAACESVLKSCEQAAKKLMR
jgi:hypothetical protein